MATLTISDEVYARLAAAARDKRVTVDEAAEALLADATARRERGRELRRLFDEIASRSPEGVGQADSLRLLREDRDR